MSAWGSTPWSWRTATVCLPGLGAGWVVGRRRRPRAAEAAAPAAAVDVGFWRRADLGVLAGYAQDGGEAPRLVARVGRRDEVELAAARAVVDAIERVRDVGEVRARPPRRLAARLRGPQHLGALVVVVRRRREFERVVDEGLEEGRRERDLDDVAADALARGGLGAARGQREAGADGAEEGGVGRRQGQRRVGHGDAHEGPVEARVAQNAGLGHDDRLPRRRPRRRVRRREARQRQPDEARREGPDDELRRAAPVVTTPEQEARQRLRREVLDEAVRPD